MICSLHGVGVYKWDVQKSTFPWEKSRKVISSMLKKILHLLEYEERQVVRRWFLPDKDPHIIKDTIFDITRRFHDGIPQYIFETFFAVLLLGFVHRFRYTIGVKGEDIVSVEADLFGLITDVVDHAKRQSAGFELDHLAGIGTQQVRKVVSCIDIGYCMRGTIQDHDKESDKPL